MATVTTFFRNALLAMLLFITASCAATNKNNSIVLIGSTPGDEAIKHLFSIAAATKIDFIKWNLELDNESSFVLNITYGESQPNTLGLIGGGQQQNIKGTYTIEKNGEYSRFTTIYHLKSNSLQQALSLATITENVFHILTLQQQLMIGNGGWSYSLNRKVPVDSAKLLIAPAVLNEKALQLVFDGRTPCREIAAAHPEMNANASCFKIKWRLILNRDSVTYLPTTCVIRNIADNQPRNITGKWEVVKGMATNPDAVIYKITVTNLANPILLLAGDENVLFFLDNKNIPITGNENFSFALNKQL